jgi:two-component system, LuxR family, response regulator FixJ
MNVSTLAKSQAAGAHAEGADRFVYVIDDNSDLRKSLHFLLATSDITAWPFATSEDFFDHLPSLAPGPILLDMRMAGMDGLQTLSALQDRNIRWPVIVMSAHGDIAIAVRAMKLGAIEFLEKPFGPKMLDNALAQAFQNLEAIESSSRAENEARRLLDGLSPRETEIVPLLVEGMANKTVAHRLGLSVRTVEMHRSNALNKLGVKSVAGMVALVAHAGR